MPLEMNPEIRARWTAALRSGDYEQASGALCRSTAETGKAEAYCCLGVLTDLWLKDGGEEMVPDETGPGGAGALASVWANVEGILSIPVVHWAGLDDADPVLSRSGPGEGQRATELNDSGYTFAEIADAIDGGQS